MTGAEKAEKLENLLYEIATLTGYDCSVRVDPPKLGLTYTVMGFFYIQGDADEDS